MAGDPPVAQAPGLGLKGTEKLLFVRLGRLGDLLAASWLFKVLKKSRPGLTLSLLTLEPCRELLRRDPDLDEVHTYRRWMPLESLAWMRLRGFQALVDLNDSASQTSTLLCRFSGVPLTGAFRFEKNRRFYGATVQAPSSESSHILERLAVMARFLGADPSAAALRPCLYLDEPALDRARSHLQASRHRKGPLVAFNLSAGQASRLWTFEGWLELARRLRAFDQELEIVVLSGPGDAVMASRLARHAGPDRMILPQGRGFHDFAAYIHEAALLVSPDTSAIHVASAFERPVVGLYPKVAWNLASWRPFGTRCEVLQSKAEGRGDFEAEDVFNKAAALLKALRGNLA
jgi:ADP-heptose:LPS heptosyltransferase